MLCPVCPKIFLPLDIYLKITLLLCKLKMTEVYYFFIHFNKKNVFIFTSLFQFVVSWFTNGAMSLSPSPVLVLIRVLTQM